MLFPSNPEGVDEPYLEFRNLSSSYFPTIAPERALSDVFPVRDKSLPRIPSSFLAPQASGSGPSSPLPTPTRHRSSLSLDSSSASEIVLDANSSTPTRSGSGRSYVSSPLNPAYTYIQPTRPVSFDFTHIPSEDIRALCRKETMPPPGSRRASMVLYRLIDPTTIEPMPPFRNENNRSSSISSTDSAGSISSDSKYPLLGNAEHGMVAYSFDPLLDDDDDDDDTTFDEARPFKWKEVSHPRLGNACALVLLLAAIISLLVVYPIVAFTNSSHYGQKIADNPRINRTGQADLRADRVPRSQAPLDFKLDSTLAPTLIFSDEFDRDRDYFAAGDDPLWRLSNGATPFARIFQGNAVLQSSDSDSEPSSLQIRRPLCIQHGFLEVSYRLQGEAQKRRLLWSRVEEDSVWLDIRIDNLAAQAGNVVWIDAIRLYQWEEEPTSLCTYESPTQVVSLSPFLSR